MTILEKKSELKPIIEAYILMISKKKSKLNTRQREEMKQNRIKINETEKKVINTSKNKDWFFQKIN